MIFTEKKWIAINDALSALRLRGDETLRSVPGTPLHKRSYEDLRPAGEIVDMLKEHEKAVDAVVVTRCRDCFWCLTRRGKCNHPGMANRKVSPDGYCENARQRAKKG